MSETRALYRPGRGPTSSRSAGENLPRGHSPDSVAAREAIATAMTDPTFETRVARPLHATDDQYGELVEDRMRNMTLAERIEIEIELTKRFRTAHSYDYDPLKY